MKKIFIDSSIEKRDCGQIMGSGMFAVQNIKKDKLIAYVDPDEFIIYDLRIYHEFQQLENIMNVKDQKILFALYLSYIFLQPKSKKIKDLKKQRKYLKQLPKNIDNLICWSSQQLKTLRNEDLINTILQKKNRILSQFQQIKSVLQPIIKQEPNQKVYYRFFSNHQDLLNISQGLLLKMYSIIESRNMHYICQSDKDSHVGALVPIIQIFNHSNNNQIEAKFAHGRYEAKTLRDIQKGEQLFVKYGQHQIQRFLQWYGFIPDIPQQIEEKCKDQNLRAFLAKVYNALQYKQDV